MTNCRCTLAIADVRSVADAQWTRAVLILFCVLVCSCGPADVFSQAALSAESPSGTKYFVGRWSGYWKMQTGQTGDATLLIKATSSSAPPTDGKPQYTRDAILTISGWKEFGSAPLPCQVVLLPGEGVALFLVGNVGMECDLKLSRDGLALSGQAKVDYVAPPKGTGRPLRPKSLRLTLRIPPAPFR